MLVSCPSLLTTRRPLTNNRLQYTIHRRHASMQRTGYESFRGRIKCGDESSENPSTRPRVTTDRATFHGGRAGGLTMAAEICHVGWCALRARSRRACRKSAQRLSCCVTVIGDCHGTDRLYSRFICVALCAGRMSSLGNEPSDLVTCYIQPPRFDDDR